MAITWAGIEAAIEASVASQATSIISAATTDLKTAIDTFLAKFTGDADEDYATIATFLDNLGVAITTKQAMLTAEEIVAEIPATMSGWVTTALEASVEDQLGGDAVETVATPHEPYLPNQPAEA